MHRRRKRGGGGGREGQAPPPQHTLWPPNNPPICTGKTIPLNSILEFSIISYFKMRNVIIWHWLIKNLMGTRRRNDVDATSLRRIDVVTTSCACWEFGPLGPPKILNLGPPNILNLPTSKPWSMNTGDYVCGTVSQATLKCLSIGTPKTINFPFVSNWKLMVFRCPNIQTHYNEAVIYLNFGTPKNNEFSIWNKWKIYYF